MRVSAGEVLAGGLLPRKRKPDQSGLRERMRQKLIKKAGEELMEKLETRVNNWL